MESPIPYRDRVGRTPLAPTTSWMLVRLASRLRGSEGRNKHVHALDHDGWQSALDPSGRAKDPGRGVANEDGL